MLEISQHRLDQAGGVTSCRTFVIQHSIVPCLSLSNAKPQFVGLRHYALSDGWQMGRPSTVSMYTYDLDLSYRSEICV